MVPRVKGLDLQFRSAGRGSNGKARDTMRRGSNFKLNVYIGIGSAGIWYSDYAENVAVR